MLRALLVALLVATACGGATSRPVPAAEAKVILAASLTDVRTGAAFTLGGFSGQVVLVEGMAVWCPLCTDQQRQIRAALPSLGDVVVVSLDTDPNESAEILRRYVERMGFDWRFAVVRPALANELAAAFGTEFMNPPSTPLIVIDAKGEAHRTPGGIKSASQIKDLVAQYR